MLRRFLQNPQEFYTNPGGFFHILVPKFLKDFYKSPGYIQESSRIFTKPLCIFENSRGYLQKRWAFSKILEDFYKTPGYFKNPRGYLQNLMNFSRFLEDFYKIPEYFTKIQMDFSTFFFTNNLGGFLQNSQVVWRILENIYENAGYF